MTVEQTGATERPETRARALLILLGIVAVVGLLFFLLMSGGGDDDGTATPPPPRRPRPTASPTRSPQPPPVETDERFEGRDPFQPLVTAEVEDPGPGGSPTSPPDTGTVGGTDGNGDGVTEEPRRVALLDIFREDGERLATVEVDEDQFTVREGETFADNFRVLDLTSECGTFVFGDERFTLCIGQEVRK